MGEMTRASAMPMPMRIRVKQIKVKQIKVKQIKVKQIKVEQRTTNWVMASRCTYDLYQDTAMLTDCS